MTTLHSGSQPFTISEGSLRGLFFARGTAESARTVLDRDTGRSRGYGDVETEEREVRTAIAALNNIRREIGKPSANTAEQHPPRQAKQQFTHTRDPVGANDRVRPPITFGTPRSGALR